MPIDRGDGQLEAVVADFVADRGSRPSAAITNPRVSYGPSGSSNPVDSANSSRLSRPSTSTALSISRRGSRDVSVVLVADVTDDFLDQVLERHDAVRSAVLVDDDRQVVPFAPHLGERRQHLLRSRHALTVPHEVTDRRTWSPRAAPKSRSRICTNPRTSSWPPPITG